MSEAETTETESSRRRDGTLDALPLAPKVRSGLGLALFAALVYVPLLRMHPGKVDADTKSYLYLDAGRFLERAASLWDPSIGLGTLSHQTIGYLFPMGPFYWVLEDFLGLPSWISQRLWLGTTVLLAGLGVRYLLRTFDIRGAGVPIAMLVYAFTPYVLGYSSIYSVILGPWAALPWWIAFTARAMRNGGWKYPALFAITVQIAGALNGSALLFSLIGPALLIPYVVLITREQTWRRAWTVVWRVGLLSLLTSLWWFVPLAIEGQYGLNILRFTESIEIVALTSLPFEILRGLGNWYFYGKDRVGFWADGRIDFTQRSLYIFVSMAIPALAILAAGVLRWRNRAYFVVLLLVGVAISVGAEPYEDPSIAGSAFKSWALTSNLGFALRNTGRAVPLVVLSLAVLLGAGVTALVRRLQERGKGVWGLAVAGLVGVLCLVNASPALYGKYYSRALERDERVPRYWERAIADLDARPHDTRVLALPGADFASYRWGDTRDPIEPGLMDRPYVARELVTWGTGPSVNLLRSLDRRIQEGEGEVNALAPLARLMGVGDVLLRMDLESDRWGILSAERLWKLYAEDPTPGFGPLRRYGTKIPGQLTYPDIGDLTKPVSEEPSPPPVAVMPVEDPLPIVRTKSAGTPVVVDGDGEGVLDMAGAGLLDTDRLLLYAASFADDPDALRALPDDTSLMITDSNRRRGTRWSGLRFNDGYTEQAGEEPLLADPSDQRIELFPDATDAAKTVAILNGVKSVRADRYGASFGLSPSERPARAFDGSTESAWLVDRGEVVKKHRLRVELDRPVTTDRLDVVQYLESPDSVRPLRRFISRVGLRFDDGPTIPRRLDKSSRTEAGQEIRFPKQTFSTFEISFDGVPEGRLRSPQARNPVGFAEIRIADEAPGSEPVRVDEVIRMPTTVLDALGARSQQHPLTVLISAEESMDQRTVNREFTLPTERAFSLAGTALLSDQADDDVVDRALHLPGAEDGGVTATSGRRLEQPLARSSSALDGDLTTAWQTKVGFPIGEFTVRLPAPRTIDHLDLQLVTDARHSVPQRIEITGGDGTARVVDLPAVPARSASGVTAVPVSFEPLTGDEITVAVRRSAQLKRGADPLPVGIAELGIEGVRRAPVPTDLPADCLPDLITVDGEPFPVRISGSTPDAVDRRLLDLAPCDPGAELVLGPGRHTIRSVSSPDNPTGFDVRRLVLTSGAGGAAASASEIAQASDRDAVAAPPPEMRVVEEGRSSMKVDVEATDEPFWLVLGQSNNVGWTASADGRDLGEPELVDGFANGWLVEPSRDGGPMTISVSWAPQRTVRIALWISLIAGLACIGVVVVATWRRRRRGADAADEVDPLADVGVALGSRALGFSTRATVLTALTAALVTALLVRPWVGLVVGVLTALAVLRPGWRLVLRIGPAVIVGAIAVYMAIAQYVNKNPAFHDWPTNFAAARVPAWLAVMLLAADALISVVALRTRPQEPQLGG